VRTNSHKILYIVDRASRYNSC